MRKIKSQNMCKHINRIFSNCPCACPEGYFPGDDCLKCPTHCACCYGPDNGLCNKCNEKNCGNRTMPYDPNSVPKEE